MTEIWHELRLVAISEKAHLASAAPSPHVRTWKRQKKASRKRSPARTVEAMDFGLEVSLRQDLCEPGDARLTSPCTRKLVWMVFVSGPSSDLSACARSAAVCRTPPNNADGVFEKEYASLLRVKLRLPGLGEFAASWR